MCLSGLFKAFSDRGGFPEVVWKGEENGPISFQLVIELEANEKEPRKTYEYEISITGSSISGLFSIEKENLGVKVDDKIFTLIDIRGSQGKVTHMDGSLAFHPVSAGSSALEYAVPGWEGMKFKEYISKWRYYRLLPAQMKQANTTVTQEFLTENGDNFSSWFMTLQTKYPSEFRLIEQVARDVFPELEVILTPPTQFATTYLSSKEKYLKREIPIWHMSDGEIVFLAWLSLIFSPLGAPLYCVEELENHLHPKLLETLVEILNQRQRELGPKAAQIITTTHSPYLVDKVNLDDLIVVEKSNGATRCLRPSSKTHLKELLEREELGLGELWYSGALGGN
jgi:predicted ATPase